MLDNFDYTIIDGTTNKIKEKKHWSIISLIVSLILYITNFGIIIYWTFNNLSGLEELAIWTGFSIFCAGILNIVGFIVAIVEFKRKRSKAMIGLIGNGLLLLFFLLIIKLSIDAAY